jgi:hypothetical protein
MDSEPLIVLAVIALWLISANGPAGVAALQNTFNGHAGLPPREREFIRGGRGGGLLAVAAYLFLAPLPGRVFSREHLLIAVAVLTVWGLFALAVGIRRSRGNRDSTEIAKCLLPLAAGVAGFYGLHVYNGLAPLLIVVIAGYCIYLIASGITGIVLALRGVPGDARKLVAQQVDEKTVVWRSARKRS